MRTLDKQEGYFHTVSSDDRRFGIWVNIAGHYTTHKHRVMGRTMDDYQLLYCVKGKGKVSMGTSTWEIQPGDLFIVVPNIPHTYYCDPDEGWEVWWVHFQGPYAKQLMDFAHVSLSRFVFKLGVSKKLIGDLSAIMRLIKTKDYGSALSASSKLISIFVEIKKTAFYRELPGAMLLSEADYEVSSVDALAKKAGYSKYHFIRKFKRMTGLSPWHHILLMRISRAKEMLISGLSVKETAHTLGFRDPNYFSRVFRKKTGLSPLDFRTKHQ
ncbi:MAG: helix-turn-helix domain-containing protein [Spirochaetes bacterium]|nr:helix-turn-helix domain-containing protein [Spirochaetota bacterium]